MTIKNDVKGPENGSVSDRKSDKPSLPVKGLGEGIMKGATCSRAGEDGVPNKTVKLDRGATCEPDPDVDCETVPETHDTDPDEQELGEYPPIISFDISDETIDSETSPEDDSTGGKGAESEGKGAKAPTITFFDPDDGTIDSDVCPNGIAAHDLASDEYSGYVNAGDFVEVGGYSIRNDGMTADGDMVVAISCGGQEFMEGQPLPLGVKTTIDVVADEKTLHITPQAIHPGFAKVQIVVEDSSVSNSLPQLVIVKKAE